jgi:glutamate 5-kinase
MVADMSGNKFDPENCPFLVVKVGSSLLVDPDGSVRREWLEKLVAELAQRHRDGQQLLIVSSGAIALGSRRLGLEKGGRATLSDAQASASVGQIILSSLWAELLGAQGMTAAQLLLTLHDLENRRSYLNISSTLRRLRQNNVVPVVNENDSVTTQEIRFGDNDRLAARVAQAAGANGVLLLSDIDGLYDRHPAHPDAAIIAEVPKVDSDIAAMADDGGPSSGMGSGGMASKLQAAQIANMAGISLAIISGQHDSPLTRFAQGGPGTWFHPQEEQSARKTWLGGLLSSSGQVYLDAGAIKALRNGNSLLPVGVVRIAGNFERGDVVDILDRDGAICARGLSEYCADDARLIIGKASDEIEAILGHAPRSALVHRDHMAML